MEDNVVNQVFKKRQKQKYENILGHIRNVVDIELHIPIP